MQLCRSYYVDSVDRFNYSPGFDFGTASAIKYLGRKLLTWSVHTHLLWRFKVHLSWWCPNSIINNIADSTEAINYHIVGCTCCPLSPASHFTALFSCSFQTQLRLAKILTVCHPDLVVQVAKCCFAFYRPIEWHVCICWLSPAHLPHI